MLVFCHLCCCLLRCKGINLTALVGFWAFFFFISYSFYSQLLGAFLGFWC